MIATTTLLGLLAAALYSTLDETRHDATPYRSVDALPVDARILRRHGIGA